MSDKLTDGEEMLFRQIHPSFIEDGQPSSQPFRPTSKDKGLLSVDRGSQCGAGTSYERYVGTGLLSVAVYGLTVAEFDGEQIDCHPDPIEEVDGAAANPDHATADYSPHNENRHKLIAKRLKKLAIERGQLHP